MALTKRGRTALIAGSCAAALVLVGGGITYAALSKDEPEPVATSTPTPTPTPTPEPAEIPISTPVKAMFDGWQGADSHVIADVMPQIGDAAEGRMSAFIDAPKVAEPTNALSIEVPVEQGTEYTLTAQVRQGTIELADAAAELVIGDETIPFGEINGDWSEIEGSFTADADTATIAVRVTDAVAALGVDEISLTLAGGENVVPNGSFEQVTSDWGVRNNTLLLRETGAAMGVALADGDASWSVAARDGSEVASGTETVEGGFARIALDDVAQGYYTFSVTDADGRSVSTPFGVIDYAGATIATDDRFGVATHVDQNWYFDSADAIAGTGIGLARNDVLWDQNEKTPGQYSFSPHYTDEFGKFSSHGVQLLGIVNYGNPLYDGGNTPASPAAVEAFGAYAAAIAQNFDVAGLEVFNEFNHDRFQTGSCGSAPVCYQPLVKSTADHVAAVNPDLPIVAGSTANYDGDWFRGLWPTGAADSADAMSFHPYNKWIYDTPESLGSVMDEANGDMQNLAGKKLPIWITEFGWTTGAELGQQVSRDVQAERLWRAQLTAFAYGAEKYFWYDLIDDSTDPNNHEGNFGMYEQRRDGVAAQPPKPAAFAQALLINAIDGRETAGRAEAGDKVRSAVFGSGDDTLTAVWSFDGEREASLEATGPVTVTSLTGEVSTVEPENGMVTLTVGSSPLLVESSGAAAEEPETEASATPAPGESGTPTPTPVATEAAKPEDDK